MKKLLLIISTFFFTNCNSQNKFDLDEMLRTEPDYIVVMKIAAHINQKSNHGEEMEKLNPSQRMLIIVENLESEINNGGFDQFYLNSSGDYANETVDILNKIGAIITAKIVKQANDEFPNGIVPKERGKRLEILGSISNETSEKWNKLDYIFYGQNKDFEEIDIDNLPALLIEFIKLNKSDFEN